MGEYSRPTILARDHDVAAFECGTASLTTWLVKYGHNAQESGTSRVFVTCPTGTPQVVGYYAIAAGQVDHAEAPARLTKGVGRHPIPVAILTRLAVDAGHQGRPLGTSLLVDALRRVDVASEAIGMRALLIHAESTRAKAFYLGFAEFEESPTDPLHIILLMKDLRRALQQAYRRRARR
jgi:GNAT superfamily N-acetyltransferase